MALVQRDADFIKEKGGMVLTREQLLPMGQALYQGLQNEVGSAYPIVLMIGKDFPPKGSGLTEWSKSFCSW